MVALRMDERRLRQIRARQRVDRFGPDYVPAQWATPQEAPSRSMPSIVRPLKLGGRECHLMSRNELWACLLALHHPGVFDVHEQHVLSPGPRPHYLAGHPRALGQRLPEIRGTVDVTNRLGLLGRHPKCAVRDRSGNRTYSFFPYLGDLLLYLQDAQGAYVVNWSVKDKHSSFFKPPSRFASSQKTSKLTDEMLPRTVIEQLYFQDAGIQTRHVVGSSIDLELRDNLCLLFTHDADLGQIDRSDEMVEFYAWHIGRRVPANQLVRQASERFQQEVDACRTVLLAAVWRRDLRIDLFSPFLIDRPLAPMRADPLVVYEDWFKRG